MTRVRPARPWAPIPVSAFVLFIWWVVAHNSGSGWVQFLGDAAFGTIVVGIAGPPVVLSRARIRLMSAPTDGTAGLPASVQLSASSRIRVRPIEPPGPERMIGPTNRGRSDDDVILLPLKRGVHSNLIVEVASAAPFGLQWWSRRLTVALPAAIHVAPRRGQRVPLPRLDLGDTGDPARPIASQVGDPRGVRHYRAGDQRRRMHWPSTAHTGELMVRELEGPSVQPVTLRVDLPADDEAAERTAESALGTAIAVLDRGAPLVMSTDEPKGAVVAPVDSRVEAGRRLARAVALGGLSRIEVSR
jgi:uncharacterized protein (DUF58 family)